MTCKWLSKLTKGGTVQKKIRRLAMKSYLREGDDVSQRIDWSLIFHGILLEAFFAIKQSVVQHLAI